MDDRRLTELVKAGVPVAEAQAWLAEQDAEDTPAQAAGPFVVWPENWAAVDLFLRAGTQWRLTPSGHLQGLRYGEVDALMRLLRLKKRRRLFLQLQEMETAALEAWDERQH